MNIPHETQELAKLLGLESWSTGGGCDYAGYWEKDTSISFQISDKLTDHAGGLDQPAEMFIYDGIDHQAHLTLEFPTMLSALAAASNANFRNIGLLALSEQLKEHSQDRANRLEEIGNLSEDLVQLRQHLSFSELLEISYGVRQFSFVLLPGFEIDIPNKSSGLNP